MSVFSIPLVECILHLGRTNPTHQCVLEVSWLESSSVEKDPEVLVEHLGLL